MSKSSRGMLGGVVALGLVSSGSAFGYRTRMVSQRREAIAAEQREADQHLAEAKERARIAEASYNNAMRGAEEMRSVVTTLWADRRHRYEKTVRDMESYLVAAPESVGVLQGIIHHCKFLESVLPSFVRFDARAHQINSLLLALTAGRSKGLTAVAPDLAKLHGYDPFVRVISEHVVGCVGADEAPRSMKEVSDSFAYCHNTLAKAIDAAQSSLVVERTVVPESPSLATQALSVVLDSFKVKRSAASLVNSQMEMEKVRRHQADLRVLNTHADVRAALAYSDQLTHSYRSLIAEATAANAPSPFADPRVGEAVAQLSMWRESVLTFLLQDQAQRALDAYSMCIVDTLTQITNEGLPETNSKAAH